VDAASEDAVKAEFFNDLIPVGGSGYGTVVRALQTPFIEEMEGNRELVRREAPRLAQELTDALRENTFHELLPAAGQTSGGVKEVLPAGEIVQRMIAEAEAALGRAPTPS
jgi:NAD(P)H-dependent flavin oxidoreductase YrpB (nitropropane dioxygenase family)